MYITILIYSNSYGSRIVYYYYDILFHSLSFILYITILIPLFISQPKLYITILISVFLTLFLLFLKFPLFRLWDDSFLLSFVVRRLYYSVLVVRRPRSYGFALHSTIPDTFGCDAVLQHPVLVGNIPFIPLLHPYRIPYSTGI